MGAATLFFIVKTIGFSSLSRLNLLTLYHSVQLVIGGCCNV